MSGLQLMIPPFVACMVLVAMLSYLGLHVIAREVIFVDLSLAQMAALGGLSALLIHVEADSTWAYAFALFATAVGALLFALTRTSSREGRRVPQEAFIGIVYVVASAAAVLVANKVPGGGEAIEKTLTGSATASSRFRFTRRKPSAWGGGSSGGTSCSICRSAS